jgi:hypothetical protein
MNDSDVLDHVRQAAADIHMDVPVEAIVARGRARRARRRRRAVAVGACATIAVAALAVGAEQVGPPSGHAARVTAQLATFTVSTTPGGSTALTLRKGYEYRLDPVALRQALADHGVPALVSIGKTCDTNPEPNGLDEVLSSTRNADGAVYLTIDAAAMPRGAELSIGYYPSGTSFGLIEAGAPLHCASHPPARSVGVQPRPVGSN